MAPRGLRSRLAPAAKDLLIRTPVYPAVRRLLPHRGAAILRYHAVCDPGAGYADPGICVSPEGFEVHARYLARHYNVMPLPAVASALQSGVALRPNTVAITFDDGYADNLEAARTLARHGLSATFYITAGCLSGGAPFWPSELRAIVAAIKAPSITVVAAGERLTIPLASSSDRQRAVRTLTKLFKGHTIPEREAIRDQIRVLAGGSYQSPMLTWDDVRAMHQMGMVIGSHTMTHPNLPNAGLADAEREIRDSKARLEHELGAPVTMFSYPNGGADRYMTPEVARLVRDAGYAAATTSRNGFASRGSDVFALERVQVSEELRDLAFALEVERFAFKPQPRPGERS